MPGLFVALESQKHPFLYHLRPTRVSIKGVGFSPRSKRAAPFCEKKRGYILFEVDRLGETTRSLALSHFNKAILFLIFVLWSQ